MKSLFLFIALIALTTFTSCEKPAESDPKVGDWEAKNVSIPGLSTTSNFDLEITFTDDDKFMVDVYEAGSTTAILTSEAVLESTIDSETYVYKAVKNTLYGSSTTIDFPYSKIKADVDGNSMKFLGYEVQSTPADAAAETTVDIDATFTRK